MKAELETRRLTLAHGNYYAALAPPTQVQPLGWYVLAKADPALEGE